MPFITMQKNQFTGEALRLEDQLYATDEEVSKSESEEIVDYDSDFEWVEDPHTEVIRFPGIDNIIQRTYLYAGDARGYIKIWSLNEIIRESNAFFLERSEREKPSYNPRRKDEKNAESDVKFWLKESVKFEMPSSRNHEHVLVREWKAHNDALSSIRIIQEPSGLVSCSQDKFVKIWSFDGDAWGIINLNSPEPPKKWHFPFDWDAKRATDIKKVMEVMNLIDEKIDFDP